MKHVLFIQGGGEGAHEADAKLAASLQAELGTGYEVRFPKMPNEDAPEYPDWVRSISEELAALGEGAVLVAHSLGASMVIKFLVEGRNPRALAGVFLIASPFWGDGNWEWPEVELPAGARARLTNTGPLFFYHGSEDEIVPVAHLDLYAKAFPDAPVHRLSGRDHQLNDNLSEVAADIARLNGRPA
jgi:predicted alpha/beta hydrolase family esterase